MTMSSPDDTTAVRPPVVTVGPCGSGFLSIDPSADLAVAHLRDHATGVPGTTATTSKVATPAPEVTQLTFFDAGGRTLRLDTADGRPHLVIADHSDHTGEMRARIDETIAHLRERAYRDPRLLADSGVDDPDMLRPPDEDADDYLDQLAQRLSYEPPIEDHVGGWWHNLIHRLG